MVLAIHGHQLQSVGNYMTQFDQLKKFFQENQFPILMFFVLSILISIIFPTGFSIRYSYQLDDIAREPIIAPFDFGILKTETANSNGQP